MNNTAHGEWQSRLRGALIPAVPVPFRRDGRMDAKAQESYVRYMADQPVGGVAVWAHTGRGLLISREQREQVLKSWRHGLDPRVAVVAGVGGRADVARQAGGGPGDAVPAAPSRRFIDDAVRMAEDAAAWGADVLMAYAPVLYRGQPDQDEAIVEYHRRLAAVGKPLILFFLYEGAGGITYGLPVLRELFALPGVIGIKMATLDRVMTFQDVAALVREAAPDSMLITGEDRFLGYSLMMGACAALVGMGAACARLQANMMKAYFNGDGARFLDLSAKVDAFSQATFVAPMEGYIRRMLHALALLGVIPAEAAYDPFGPDVPAEQLARVEQVMRDLGELGA